MKRILLTIFLYGCFNLVNGQSTTTRFTGMVLDSVNKVPLELATVSILNEDSTLFGYQISDNNGRFVFEKLPLGKKFFLNISYVGYSDYRKSILLQKADSVTVFLTVNVNDSNGVVVKSVMPIRMNGDTLEINPAAFKMKPNAVVEEMLNEVSGITIWSDGTITINGRRVHNFLVEGKPFMGSTDPRVATQNLPKTAIDKIQVYQEYDRNKIGEQNQPQDSLLTMNVKLKEDSKTGYFGKTGAGYGTTGRYESDLSFQMYNKRSSGGIGGGINNINKSVQNLQEIFQNNTFRSFNPNLYNTGRFGGSGITKSYSLGGTFMHSLIEATNSRQNNRLNGSYTTSGSNTYLTSQSLQTRTTLANPQVINSDNVQNNHTDRHALSLSYIKSNSYNDNINVSGNIDMSNNRGNSMQLQEVKDTSGNLQSTNKTTSTHKGHSNSEGVNMGFARSDQDNPLKGFNLQLNARHNYSESERNTNSVFQSLINPSADTTYNRQYATVNESISVGGTLNYTGFKRLILGRYNLFGINLNFNQWFNYSQTASDSKVGDFDNSLKKFVANNRLSNYNKHRVFEYTPSLSMNKSFFSFANTHYRSVNLNVTLMEDFKTDNNISSIGIRNLRRTFQFFRYTGNISYQYQKNNKYSYHTSINYSKNFGYASVDQLYTIVDDINAYDIRVGNPNLKNRVNHNLNLYGNFNTQSQKSPYSFNGNFSGGLTRSENPVADSVINDPAGKRISYIINADQSKSYNANAGLNIARKIKKSSIQLMYNMNYSTSESPNYIDREYTLSKSNSLNNQFTLQFSLRTVMVIGLTKSYQRYSTRQTGAGLTNFSNNNNTTRISFTLNYPENFSFGSTLDQINNSNLATPTTLWNCFATYRFMQQQGELKFSAMDILKQYRNISNSANAYGTTTTVTNGLQQYFMVTFSYYPRKIGKMVLKPRSGERRDVSIY